MDFLDGSFLARWLNAGLIEGNECTNINPPICTMIDCKLYRFSTRCGFPPCRRSTGTRQEQYIELMLAMIEWSGVRKAKIFSCLFLFSWLLFLIKIRICVPVPGEWSGEGQQARIFFSSSVHLYWKIINKKGLIELQKKMLYWSKALNDHFEDSYRKIACTYDGKQKYPQCSEKITPEGFHLVCLCLGISLCFPNMSGYRGLWSVGVP